MKLYTLILVFCLTCLSVSASLVWEIDQVKFDAKPTDKSLKAVFPFTNSGDMTVTISKLKSSCGCTVGQLDKKIYAPGESGEVSVVYKMGKKVGRQRQTITVRMDDKANPIKVLTVIVQIPKVLKIQPKMLLWRVGRPPEMKDVTLEVDNSGLSVNIISVKSDSDNITASLEKSNTAGKYVLYVTPLSTEKRGKSKIVVSTDYPKSDPKEFTIFIFIK